MPTSEPSNAAPASHTRNQVSAARSTFGGRLGWGLVAVAVLGIGAALNWSWLVAIGVAPLILAVAPCAAMCALGVCMSKQAGGSCSKDAGPASPLRLRGGSRDAITDGSDFVENASLKITTIPSKSKATRNLE